MQMVILCGGLATRLGDLAKTIPKSMQDINGKPFLWYQLQKLKENNITDILLCVGHLSTAIEEYFSDGTELGLNIKYSHDGEKQLGPIGAVKKAEKILQNDFFIMYGDSYLDVDYQKVIEFYKQNRKPSCMVVYKNKDQYDKSNMIVENNMVVGYGSSSENNKVEYIDYGTSLLNIETLKLVSEDSYCSTGDFFEKLIDDEKLLAYEVKNRFYHIGNPEALAEVKKLLL